MISIRPIPLLLSACLMAPTLYSQKKYNNFTTSVYCRVYEVEKMENIAWLKKRIEFLEQYIGIDKIYLETHRDLIIVNEQTIKQSKTYLEEKGIEVAGGITLVTSERNRFKSFCYSDPDHLLKIAEIVRYTARFFDEIILDDFFFTNCKCDKCILSRGNASWSEFRMQQLTRAAKEVVIKPAKEVNPAVQIIIKYPNWYEHFHYLGFNLENEPAIFDGIYTGTETRDPAHSHQHLQQYQSYGIMRYFENVSPGKNGGGWIDPYGLNNLDRYIEQISLTAFSKPKEITLFAIHNLIEEIYSKEGDTAFVSRVAPLAGYALQKADNILGQLGKPVGIPAYRPFHSVGEDFLHNYLGMIGIPMEITSNFPTESNRILLTQNAAFDPEIVTKIKDRLLQGKHVIITSGLLKALQEKGIEEIAQIRYTDRKIMSQEFSDFRTVHKSDRKIMLPVIIYPTNDTWELITAYSEGNGFPLLLQAEFGNGVLYVLTIPDNFNDLYNLPQGTLSLIKEYLMQDINVSIDGPAQVGLFLYDNNTFIVQSFLSEREMVNIVVKGAFNSIIDINTNQVIEGRPGDGDTIFPVHLGPHVYRAFRLD